VRGDQSHLREYGGGQYLARFEARREADHIDLDWAAGSAISLRWCDLRSEDDFTETAGLRAWYGSNVNFISAQTQGSGGAAGAGNPAMVDFAYAYSSPATTHGLVGWMSAGGTWVVPPLL